MEVITRPKRYIGLLLLSAMLVNRRYVGIVVLLSDMGQCFK